MKFTPHLKNQGKYFKVIDSHTMGEPTRIIYEGFPKLQGETMIEKKEFLEKNFDHYRTALMLEPRGHRDMFGALFTEPTDERADIGVIFMDSGGYLNMCGHGSIGSATVAVETGMVDVKSPETTVVLDAPAGIIRANVSVENGKAKEVRILNVPAFLYKENLELNLGKYGTVQFDIAFGGSFFALVDSEKIGLDIEQSNIDALIDFGMRLRNKINKTIEIRHPYLNITTVDLVEIYGPAKNPAADKRNVVIFGDAQADRSPCGTGTSAKVASLYAKGELGIGEEFVYESITGSLFKGMVTKEIEIDGMKAVIPQITGSAYITGINEWIIDDDDPLAYGFLMGRKSESPTGQDYKTQIINTAWDLFRQVGYDNVTVESIISKCNVTKEIFNKYFNNKEDLLHTLSDVFDQRYAELMVEIDPAQSSFDKLLLANRELFTMIENKIPVDLLAYLYSEEMVDSNNNNMLNKERLYYKFVTQIIAEGIESGEFKTDVPPEEIMDQYSMIERALLCEWCINRKELTKESNKLMPVLLRALVCMA